MRRGCGPEITQAHAVVSWYGNRLELKVAAPTKMVKQTRDEYWFTMATSVVWTNEMASIRPIPVLHCGR